jgi:lipid-binding SYLF domain-containing protein
MNDEGMEKLLESKFTLGGSAGVAAGPIGRSSSAQTDAHLTAGILSWSRSRGAFAGLTLEGATLRNDIDENEELYGKRLTNQQILGKNVKAPAAAQGLIATLNQFAREGTRARTTK